ncbi:MAG: hypothetical protein J4F44_00825 [Acidimicrobiia bacterium]|nr:hypothetical protein [Acidimicrobiia bacterium]
MKHFRKALVAILIVAFGAGMVPAAASAQDADVAVRIVARRLEDGRTEFGLQQRAADGDWGERLLPSRRFFPAAAAAGRWLVCSPITPAIADTDGGSFSLGDGPRSADTLIAASFERTCAVRLDGGVACWGRDRLVDQLSVAALDDVVSVSIGDSSAGMFHACVLHEDRTVSCWGPGDLGRLGQGDDVGHVLPVVVPGLTDVTAVAAGSAHTCVAHDDGGVSCWGYNADGQLGDGTTDGNPSPERVRGVSDVVALTAGNVSTCGVHSDGSVACWGWGFGTRPRKISGLSGVTSVAVGWTYNCAVTGGGAVYCWPFLTTVQPLRIAGIDDAVEVSVGDRSVCVLHRDGGVSCFGENNAAGQLGDGTTQGRLTPRRVAGVSEAVDITVTVPSLEGEAHACALLESGSAVCWGRNGFGQLGDGTSATRLTPTRVHRQPAVRGPEDSADRTGLLTSWLDAVIAELEDDAPWLRSAWDHIRDETSVTLDLFGLSGVPISCGVSGEGYACRAERMDISTVNLDHPAILEVVVHDLAHVYDLTTGLAPKKPWGAAQLYFTATYPDCPLVHDRQGVGRELLADTMRILTIPPVWLGFGYYAVLECPGVPDEVSLDAQEVVRDALAGRVPDWYTRNITSGAELWAALRLDPELHALANLAGEFGGLCTTDWITYPIDRRRIPPAGATPFRDGGC